MTTTTRDSGIRIDHPDSVAIESAGGQGGRRRRDGGIELDPQETELRKALESRGLSPIDAFTVNPAAGRDAGRESAGRRRRSDGADAPADGVSIRVQAGEDEGVVLLLEQDGVLSWALPSSQIPAGGRRRRGEGESGDRLVEREVTFELPRSSRGTEPEGRRRRGYVRDLLIKSVRAIVLKFTARAAGKLTVRFLERAVKEGIVHIRSGDVAAWAPEDALSTLPAVAADSPRVLLFIHGTFSSTSGSFGGLSATAYGKSFLERMIARYDSVVGFDHRTLSSTPEENARLLLEQLEALDWNEPPLIDIVAFSRGGLVARSMIEMLLPKSRFGGRIGKAIFVGCTNGGTRLAAPENWNRLIDFYTNLALAACRIGRVSPATAVPAEILGEVLDGVSAFVKYLVSEAVTEGGVPGLAAMEPDGEFVRSLNRTQPGQPGPGEADYRVISSNFDLLWHRQNVDSAPASLSKSLILFLADSLVDQLMNAENDLVVDTISMDLIDPHRSGFVKERLSLKTRDHVYHTSYFTNQSVVKALEGWLAGGAPDGERSGGT